MAKHKFSFLALAICFLLVISMLCGCNFNPGEDDDNKVNGYKVTVQDPNGYLIENLEDCYKAGEEVTVKTEVLPDGDLVAYLDGVSLGLETEVNEQGEYYWEFYFEMPSHDAVLSFGFSDGLTKNGITLDDATQTEIITAYYDTYIKDKYPMVPYEGISLRCFGSFDGVYVFFIDGDGSFYTQAVTIEVIAGVKFVYSSGHTMTVYSDNAFYDISEAYEQGILSYDNLVTTQQNYKACRASLYRQDYSKRAVDGITLDKATQAEIITAFVDTHNKDAYPVTKDEISLRCYGAFDGVYVLLVDVASWVHLEVITTEVIAGVKFVYSYKTTLTVYSNNMFYTIAEAYEVGILTYDNLLTTQQTYKAAHEFLYEND